MVEFISFGIRRLAEGASLPECDFYVDARRVFAYNPHRYFRRSDGRSRSVQEWLLDHPRRPDSIEVAFGECVEAYQSLGAPFRVGVFCSWGVHRSVGLAEILARRFEFVPDASPCVRHLDLQY